MGEVARWIAAMILAGLFAITIRTDEARFAVLVFIILFNSPLLAKVSK
jgi:hypothetical protein